MHLSDIKPYIAKKYHTGARKLPDSPGVSVLVNRNTGKWAALLMREWNSDTGTVVECCDIKCGQEILSELEKPYLTRPFRMRGNNWVGVRFCAETEPNVVFRLLDKAMAPESSYGCTIVVGKDFVDQKGKYHETLLPNGKPAPRRNEKKAESAGADKGRLNGSLGQSAPRHELKSALATEAQRTRFDQMINAFNGANIITSSHENDIRTPSYGDTPIPARPQNAVLDRLREMQKLYHYGDGSFEQRCKTFYEQAKFMENFEPESSEKYNNYDFRMYFPMYHELSDKQLIKYFTWRKSVRNGIYSEACIYEAYIYIYEILNGIGTSSATDCLAKLKTFEERYLKAGYGDFMMLKNLHRWMFEFALIGNGLGLLQHEDVMSYVDSATLSRDRALIVLRNPDEHEDDEVFQALVEIGGKKLESSSTIQKKRDEAVHLFAQTWRIAVQKGGSPKKGFFEQCFGDFQSFPYHPLGNAVYYRKDKLAPFVFVLNDCHNIRYDGTRWGEYYYHDLYFDKVKLEAFFHETDRKLRLYLKTGHPLQARDSEAWASALVDEVIEKDKAEKAEALRPKINISFSDLAKIRSDASETRDRLLTDDELNIEAVPIHTIEVEKSGKQAFEARLECDIQSAECEPVSNIAPITAATDSVVGETVKHPETVSDSVLSNTSVSLNGFQIQLLQTLLHGGSVKEMIAAQRGMPEIIADAINEALYDEIGDSVVICNGDSLFLVDDYRDEIEEILGKI